ncbi:hypothetical protein ACFPH6_51175 [Streptomyces xiangluensis]|uniref:Pimeloyl-ACP methyl ester carboxylesterase n=1 Tax=Streptomyces xiangluensis TaxID=2665720 RepID=A0ABV8Z5I4_9ACTN
MNGAMVPSGGWQTLDAKGGVVLRTAGQGAPLVVFPGMEGDGQSCLHMALPVWNDLANTRERQLVLVDYAEEQHATLSALIDTLIELFGNLSGPALSFWGQSFGNLLAASIAAADVLPVDRVALVSPFTQLPKVTQAATVPLSITPAALYKITTPTVGRWIFGPVDGNLDHPFFASLAAMAPVTVARRAGWLRGQRFVDPFLQIQAPVKVWLGERDRLIELDDERPFFQALTRRRSDQFTMVPGSGHVALPARSVELLRREISAWLSERD